MLTNAINNIINGVPFWYGMGKSGFMGAVSGAISFGIGTIATSQFGAVMSIGKAAFQAGMHALSSGIMSELQGGIFGSGFAAGAISSLISSGIEGLGQTGGVGTDAKGNEFALRNNFGDGPLFKATMLAAGGLSGGISSSIAGGNFWAGVRQGLITSGLNHLAHSISVDDGEDDPPGKKSKTQVRKETVKPSVAKLVEVEGNTLGVIELARDSPMAKFVRNGAPKSASISKVLKVGGNTLGAVGIGFEAAEVYNGNMSYTEFGVDTIFALAR